MLKKNLGQENIKTYWKNMMIKFNFTILLLAFNISLYANTSINEGTYKASECDVEIKIINRQEKLYYKLNTNQIENELKIDTNYLEFANLYSTFYSTMDETTFPEGKRAYKVSGEIQTHNSFIIQNYGNAMNPYIVFDGCDKYLYYKKKIDDIKTIELNLKNQSKKYSVEYLQELLEIKNIEIKNLASYNNIAYYLEQAKAYEEAVYLLEKILEKFPNRTVAYLNLGDAYWGLEDKVKAKKAYQTYIKQMKESGKEKKIPKVVLERVKG